MENDLTKKIASCALRMFLMDDTADGYDRKLRYEEDPMARARLNMEYSRARSESLAARLKMRETCNQLEDICDT